MLSNYEIELSLWPDRLPNDNTRRFVSHITYDYTPHAFTITFHDGHDVSGKIIQERCVATYAATPIDGLDTIDLAMLLQNPSIGNLGDPVSNTCSSDISFFGERKSSPSSTDKKTDIFTFKATDGTLSTVYEQSVTTYGQQ